MSEVNKTQPFRWTAKREHAALLLAQDEFSDEAIAKAIGINRTTLHNWKQYPEFQAQIGDNIGQIQAAMLKLDIAKKHKRLEVLDDLYQRAVDVVMLRAAQYAPVDDNEAAATAAARRIYGNVNVPEAVTGLLVKKETPTNSGRIAVEWNVDIGLLKEIRAYQEQAAKELGQWVEKQQVDQRQTIVRIVGVTEDDF